MIVAVERLSEAVRRVDSMLERLGTARFLAILITTGFGARLAWIACSPAVPVSDAWFYDQSAWGLAQGAGYLMDGRPSAYWPVGYPAFLAGLYTVFGHSLLAAKIAQAVLGAGTCVLLYFLGSRVFGESAGRWAALLLAVSLNDVSYSGVLWSEPLFALLFVATLLAALRARAEPRRLGWSVAAGGALGACCYVRPVPMFLPFAWLLPDLVLRGARRQAILRTSILLAVMALTIAPWTLRNQRVLGRPVLISSNGGVNLLIGNHPGATGRYEFVDSAATAAVQHDEVQRDEVAMREAVRFIRSEPWQYVKLCARRLFYLVYSDWDGIYQNFRKTSVPVGDATRYALYFACQLQYVLALLLAALAVPAVDRRDPAVVFLGITAAYWVAMHVLIVAEPRYHHPIVPILLAFSGAFLYRWASSPRGAPR